MSEVEADRPRPEAEPGAGPASLVAASQGAASQAAASQAQGADRSEGWLHALGERFRRLAEGPSGLEAMFVIGLLESSFVPIPIEIVLAPLALWQRRRVWLLASSALAGCILACILFYFLGMYFAKTVGADLVAFMGLESQMAAFEAEIAERGFWLVASISISAVPLQVATLGSGMFGYSFVAFILAIVVTRAIRYYGFVALVLLCGPPALEFVQRMHPGWRIAALAASIALTAGLFVML